MIEALTAEATCHRTAVSQVLPVAIVHANISILPFLTRLRHKSVPAFFEEEQAMKIKTNESLPMEKRSDSSYFVSVLSLIQEGIFREGLGSRLASLFSSD